MIDSPGAIIEHIRRADAAAMRQLNAETEPLEPVWEHSYGAVERGLEIALVYLAMHADREAIAHVHPLATRAWNIVIARHGDEARKLLGAPGDEWADGAPVPVQLERVGRWLESRSDEDADHVAAAVDATRQLNMWDPSMGPTPDGGWEWLLEVGQLLAMACVEGDDWGDRPEEAWAWPWHVLNARAAVCALKAVREPGVDAGESFRRLAVGDD